MPFQLSNKSGEALVDIQSESTDIHELELAKIQSVKSAKKVFKKISDLIPVAIFLLVFIGLFIMWWLSFR